MRINAIRKLTYRPDLMAEEFIYKAICVNCVIREGQCRNFYNGNLDECYNKCRHYAKAVRAIKKVLIKYDK